MRRVQETVNPTQKLPDFGSGDTITVHYKIKEGNKERVQAFRGVVIQKKGRGQTATFTVRKTTAGIGIERIFPVSSPFIDSIDINKHGKVRRARIYYFRNLSGKKAKIKERRVFAKKD
ncbi:MAG: 50S ribosomal protein L19 [Bacteroidales bacterium]|nr:50S ribosomal protein L19 [Bacteroidales bacterium]